MISGTDACMRNAISYWAMRVCVSGSPKFWNSSSLSFARLSSIRRRMLAVDAVGVLQIQHRVVACAQVHALVPRRQKAASPEAAVEGLAIAGAVRDHHHERRQVAVRAAEAVADPRPKTRLARLLRTGVDERDRRIVIDRLAVNAFHQGDVIDNTADVLEHFTDVGAILAVAFEFELRRDDRERALARGHRRDPLIAADAFGQLDAVVLVNFRVVVERIDMRRAARHEQIDHAFRLGSEVRQRREAAVFKRRFWSGGSPRRHSTLAVCPSATQAPRRRSAAWRGREAGGG